MNFQTCNGPFCNGKKLPIERFEKYKENKNGYRTMCKICRRQKNNDNFVYGVCENCGNNHESMYGSGRFCDKRCAIIYSTNSKKGTISTFGGDNSFKKICANADCVFKNKQQPIENFYFRSNGNNVKTRRSICKHCAKLTIIRYRSTFSGFSKGMLSKAKERSIIKNIDFDLEENTIDSLWNEQNGKCALSKMEMTHKLGENKKTSRHPFNMSLDRIDSSKGYTKNNVQLVCNWVQTAKSDYDQDEFIEWVKIFAKNQEINENINIPEHKLTENDQSFHKKRKEQIIQYLNEGKSQTEISKLMGVSRKTIYKSCKKYNISNLNVHSEKYSKSINISKEELYHYVIIEKLPFTTIAKIARCSDNGLRKLCKKWNIEY